MSRYWKILVAICIALFGFLILSSFIMEYPSDFSSDTSQYYLDNFELTGALNLVSAILLDFRAYDTLGEVLIIFVTISGLILLIERKE